MTSRENVVGIQVICKVGENFHLAIRVSEEGIRRMGTGDLSVFDGRNYIGLTRQTLLPPLRAMIPEHWFDHLGTYEMTERQGEPCELVISMLHEGGSESNLVFRYGTESLAPPKDVMAFVEAAVEITEPWYQQAIQSSQEQARDG